MWFTQTIKPYRFWLVLLASFQSKIMINQISKPWSTTVTRSASQCLRLQSMTVAEDDQASSGASMTDAFLSASPQLFGYWYLGSLM
jgi:hypothetical protein